MTRADLLKARAHLGPAHVIEPLRERSRWGRGFVGVLAGSLLAACALQSADPRPTVAVQPDVNSSAPVVSDGARVLDPATAKKVLAALEDEGSTDLLRKHLRSARANVGSPLILGNSARVLVDGPQTHAAMFAAIDRARDHINVESYIVSADEVGERLATALMAKRAQGVAVNLLYDSLGSKATPPEYFKRLKDGGVAVCEFNPINPAKAKSDWKVNNRNHRKLLIVDGRTGFTGGINISGVYSAGSFGSERKDVDTGWRDTHIQFEGPIVGQAQNLFIDAWKDQRCPELQQGHYFPQPRKAGNRVMRLVAAKPEIGSETYAALLAAIDQAERSVYLTYGYFVPDQRTIETLLRAAGRGVDVRLMLPGFSDFWAPLYAGRSHYAVLLEAGIRIFERQDALLHAKTAVIDGVWSTVGSTNLDWRSFVHNYEADVIVLGDDFGAQMIELFARDMRAAHEVSPAEWEQRGPVTRVKEWFARRWEYWL